MFSTKQKGLAGAMVANIALGASSIFWKQFSYMSPYVLVGFRILLSLVTLALIIFCAGKFLQLKSLLTIRIAVIHASAAALIAINWTTFIWASIHARVVESGIGYLIAPFITLAVSAMFLRTPLKRRHTLGLVIISIAILQVVVKDGDLQHWVYITIGSTWGLYTCLKRITPLDPLGGLLVETTFLSIILIVILAAWRSAATIDPTMGPLSPLLLMCGIVSIAPLWLFSKSARQISMDTVGMLQFLLPTTQFIVAIFFYRQPLSKSTLGCFLAIWITLLAIMVSPLLFRRNAGNQ